jgi:hypothetical protein
MVATEERRKQLGEEEDDRRRVLYFLILRVHRDNHSLKYLPRPPYMDHTSDG